jgi:hypothetical protein
MLKILTIYQLLELIDLMQQERKNMRETASENVPLGTLPGTLHGTLDGTPSQRLSGHTNGGFVHRAEDLIWHALGGGKGGGRGEDGDVLGGQRARFGAVAVYHAAFVLAVIAAWFSMHGMVVDFPGDPTSAVALGVGLETASPPTSVSSGC